MVITRYNKAMYILCVLFIVSIFLGQLGRFPIEQFGTLYVGDLFAFLMCLFWLLKVVKSAKTRIFALYEIYLFVLWGVSLISLISAFSWADVSTVLVGFSYWIRFVVYSGLILVARDTFRPSGRSIVGALVWLGVLFAVVGLLQFVLFPDFSSFVTHGWDPHYYRVLSTFFDPNFAGIFMSLSFLFIIDCLYGKNTYERFQKLALVLGFTILLVAIVLTFSRSTYLAFASGITVFSIMKDKRIFVAMSLLALCAFIFIPRVQVRVIGAITIDATASIRIEDYAKTIAIIADNPLLGVGFNTYRAAQSSYGYFRDDRGVGYYGGNAGAGADNSFLFTLATMGVVGLFAFVAFGIALSRSALTVPHKTYILSSIVAVFVHAQFVNSLYYPWVIAWLALTIGPYLSEHEE